MQVMPILFVFSQQRIYTTMFHKRNLQQYFEIFLYIKTNKAIILSKLFRVIELSKLSMAFKILMIYNYDVSLIND